VLFRSSVLGAGATPQRHQRVEPVGDDEEAIRDEEVAVVRRVALTFELQLRAHYGVTVLAIRRASKGEPPTIVASPSAAEVVLEGDILVIIGEDKNLEKLSAALD
jgi:K+/H+ antiporter YhaU regulatory subunit KhtT